MPRLFRVEWARRSGGDSKAPLQHGTMGPVSVVPAHVSRRKTGETRQSTIWWYNFTVAGRRIQESSKSPRETVAAEPEKKRRLEFEKGFNGDSAKVDLPN